MNDQIFIAIKESIKKNQIEELIRILESTKISINTTFGAKSETVLHIACEEKRTEIVNLLLKMGANPNQYNGEGKTPLHSALLAPKEPDQLDIDIIQSLLTHGANPNLEYSYLTYRGKKASKYPLALATLDFKDTPLTELFLKHGANPWKADARSHELVRQIQQSLQALKTAIPRANINDINQILSNSPINIIDQYIQPDRSITALSFAVTNKRWDLVKNLLEKGANPNISLDGESGSNRDTPLHRAVQHGAIDAVACLLEHDANIEAEDPHKFTPLALALFAGELNIAKLLLNKGANVNLLYGSPIFTVIDWTNDKISTQSQLDIIRMLLEKGINPWCTIRHEKTGQIQSPAEACGEDSELNAFFNAVEHSLLSLKAAVENNNVDDIEQILVSAPCSIINTPLQKNGLTALHLASSKEMIQCLSLHGARTDMLDKHGQSVLHRMVYANNRELVEQLATIFPATIHEANRAGQTPLQSAVIAGHKHIVQILLNHGANPNALDKKGRTTLHLAAQHGQEKVVDLLLANGATPDAKDKKGKVPGMLSFNRSIREQLIHHEEVLRLSASTTSGSAPSCSNQEPSSEGRLEHIGFFEQQPGSVKRKMTTGILSRNPIRIVQQSKPSP